MPEIMMIIFLSSGPSQNFYPDIMKKTLHIGNHRIFQKIDFYQDGQLKKNFRFVFFVIFRF